MPQSRCLVFLPPDRVELRPCEVAEPAPGQLLIEVLHSAISPGTELRCLAGNQVGAGSGPFIPGYLAAGRIAAVGDGCTWRVGELVHHGQGGGVVGIESTWGAHAHHVLVDEGAVLDLPDGLDTAHACIAKLAAIARHGLETARLVNGERVALVGLGIVGQLSARLARLRGTEVVAFDRNAHRVELARAAGIDAHVVESSLPEAAKLSDWPAKEFDLIVDGTGAPSLLEQVIELARDLTPWHAPARPATRYLLQGSYPGAVSFDYQKAFLKELHLLLPRDNTLADLQAALRLLASGELVVDDLLGEPISPAGAPGLYAELASGRSSRLTGLFDWSLL